MNIDEIRIVLQKTIDTPTRMYCQDSYFHGRVDMAQEILKMLDQIQKNK